MVESNTWELQVPLHRPGCCRSFCSDFFCVFGGFLFVFFAIVLTTSLYILGLYHCSCNCETLVREGGVPGCSETQILSWRYKGKGGMGKSEGRV